MDRFIGFYYDNGCSIIPNLKSNMDRFIVQLAGYTTVPYWHLKSNMDRFIVLAARILKKQELYLKSNMDRFIV